MKSLLAAVAAALLATSAAADPVKPAGPAFLRGTIVAADATTLTVHANDGATVTVALAPGYKVAAVAKIGLDAIRPNSFVGTAAKPGKGGVLEATEVHVFPETMRGVGEGHRPWDLGPTSTMTNGTVTRVGTIKHHAGRTMTVEYKGGAQQIVVPASAPVVAFAEGTPALLVAGAHVFAATVRTAGGWPATADIAVGVGGIVPPM